MITIQVTQQHIDDAIKYANENSGKGDLPKEWAANCPISRAARPQYPNWLTYYQTIHIGYIRLKPAAEAKDFIEAMDNIICEGKGSVKPGTYNFLELSEL